MSAKPYSHQAHIERVQNSSKARHGTRLVLSHMCTRSEFGKPEVTITKPQIIRAVFLDEKTVKKAIRFLTNEGSIVPIKNMHGGRGIAVTYELVALGELRFGETKVPDGDKHARMALIREILAKPENWGMSYSQASDMARRVYPLSFDKPKT